MTHLLKLELKKISIKRYILYSFIGILFSMVFVFVGLNDSTTKHYDYRTAFQMIGLVFCFYYIILFSVLTVTYIINEYTNKTILVLFSYPVDKRKLILVKLLLILLLIVISIIIGYIFCGTFVIILDKYSNVVNGDFQLSVLSYWIPTAVKAILMFSSLGVWTFIAGMIKKSVPTTLVSSMIFIYLRQFILAGTDTTEDSWLAVIIMIALTAAGVYYILTHKVKQID